MGQRQSNFRSRRVTFDVKRCQEDTTPARRGDARAPAGTTPIAAQPPPRSPRPPLQVLRHGANSGCSSAVAGRLGVQAVLNFKLPSIGGVKADPRPRPFGDKKLVVVTGTS